MIYNGNVCTKKITKDEYFGAIALLIYLIILINNSATFERGYGGFNCYF